MPIPPTTTFKIINYKKKLQTGKLCNKIKIRRQVIIIEWKCMRLKSTKYALIKYAFISNYLQFGKTICIL